MIRKEDLLLGSALAISFMIFYAGYSGTELKPEYLNGALMTILVVITLFYSRATAQIVVETKKDRKIRYIERRLEKLYYPIQQSGIGIFQEQLVNKFFNLRYLASEELKLKLKDYRYNLNAPNLEKRLAEILEIVGREIPELEKKLEELTK